MYFVEPTVPSSSAPQRREAHCVFTSGTAQLHSGFLHRRHPTVVVCPARPERCRGAPHHHHPGGAGLGLGDHGLRALKTEVLASSLEGGGPRLGRSSAPSLW